MSITVLSSTLKSRQLSTPRQERTNWHPRSERLNHFIKNSLESFLELNTEYKGVPLFIVINKKLIQMEQHITKIEITEQKIAKVPDNDIPFILPDSPFDENPNANNILLVDQNSYQSDQSDLRYLEQYFHKSINPDIHSKKQQHSSSQQILTQLSVAEISTPKNLFQNQPNSLKNQLYDRLNYIKYKINQQQSTVEGQSSLRIQKEVLKEVQQILSLQQKLHKRPTNYHLNKILTIKISIKFRQNTQLLKSIFKDILEEISSKVLVCEKKVQNVYERLQKEKENMPSQVKRFFDQEISTAKDLFYEVKQFAITIFKYYSAAYFGFMRDISGKDMSQQQLIQKFKGVKIVSIARPQFLKYEKQKNSLLYLLKLALGQQLNIKSQSKTSKKKQQNKYLPDLRVFPESSRQKYLSCDQIKSIKSDENYNNESKNQNIMDELIQQSIDILPQSKNNFSRASINNYSQNSSSQLNNHPYAEDQPNGGSYFFDYDRNNSDFQANEDL